MLSTRLRSLSRAPLRAAVRRLGTSSTWRVDNPYDGSIYCEVPVATATQANQQVSKAADTFRSWRKSKLSDRIALCERFIAEARKNKEKIAMDITGQMGKPLKEARGEVETMIKRTQALIELAPRALADEEIKQEAGLWKTIKKEPIGVVLALQPWNYPLLCAVNTVVTAVLAGNPVLLKHSDRTPLCANHFADGFKAAGAPEGLVQALHADHDLVSRVIKHPEVAFVSFTGSVPGGRAVYETVAKRFIDVGLELGGKDAAYVAGDADIKNAIDNVVDGGFYNAGQSCCAVKRVYVHQSKYDQFINGAVELTKTYKLGDPRNESTTLGPLAQARQPGYLQGQVESAVKRGARLLVGGKATKDSAGKGRFFQPTIVDKCKPDMSIMAEESFGPLLAVASVSSDEEAIKLMNDSAFGLTSSIWTTSEDRAKNIASELDSGTVFMNRCDFLDPYLSWSGRKDSGKGVGMSHLGFNTYTRTKSYNFRVPAKK